MKTKLSFRCNYVHVKLVVPILYSTQQYFNHKKQNALCKIFYLKSISSFVENLHMQLQIETKRTQTMLPNCASRFVVILKFLISYIIDTTLNRVGPRVFDVKIFVQIQHMTRQILEICLPFFQFVIAIITVLSLCKVQGDRVVSVSVIRWHMLLVKCCNGSAVEPWQTNESNRTLTIKF